MEQDAGKVRILKVFHCPCPTFKSTLVYSHMGSWRSLPKELSWKLKKEFWKGEYPGESTWQANWKAHAKEDHKESSELLSFTRSSTCAHVSTALKRGKFERETAVAVLHLSSIVLYDDTGQAQLINALLYFSGCLLDWEFLVCYI